ncbi:MAG: sulfatase-like hydrolase/transferase [Mariniphaga sp.]
MKIEHRTKLLKDKILLGCHRFMGFIVAFLLLLILVRIYEYLYLRFTITLPPEALKLEIFGIGHDILMLFNLAAWLFFPFVLIYLVGKPLASLLSGVLIIFFIFAEIALIQYLRSTSLLLGTDLFGYTLKEVYDIAATGGGFSPSSVATFLVGLILLIVLLRLSRYVKLNIRIVAIFIMLSFISLLFRQFTKPKAINFNSEMAFNLVANKAYHILTATYLYVYPDDLTEEALFSYFYTGISQIGKSFEYLSPEYPFLRKDETPDILGKYFDIGAKKPNLVFLIVESLGRAYSGEGAYLSSFTSFLDSLENKSLYWENVVSTAGRTFEVLPSVFGSMPYGKSGFAELGNDMPDGMSLISLLKERGYESRFFYGGDAVFDNMKMFLTRQHIDYIVDQSSFGPEYKKMPANAGNFTWGYGEKDIFKKAFEVLATAGQKPRLDIYLTLAMHDPYKIPDQGYYENKVEEKLTLLNFSEAKKSDYRKYIANYATVLYFNDALRSFFKEYQKREDFGNTIFFITGDHRMSSPPISTQIDRFHVPLVIYSPMLKKPVKFSSVVSHLDFTPSVVAFLKKNYKMSFPSSVPWLGQGLDSVQIFRNNRSMPFIRTKNEIIDYLDQDYFIVNNQLFKLSEGLGIDKLTEEKKLTEIQRKFEKFKTDNLNACLNNKLIPDSLKFRLQK